MSTIQVPSTQGLAAQFSSPAQILLAPGNATFTLLVNNTGNTEDAYTAFIVGTTGPVTASFIGLDGLPTQSIPLFRLPGLSSGAILLQTNLAASGQGTVTIEVKSMTNGSIVAFATATVGTAAVAVTPPPPPSSTARSSPRSSVTASTGSRPRWSSTSTSPSTRPAPRK